MTDRFTNDGELPSLVVERAPGEVVVETFPPPATESALITDLPGAEIISDVGEAFTESRRGRSPSAILWMKLRRNRTAMFGLYTLLALYAAAILAGFISPYRYDNSVTGLSFASPMLTRIHLFDEEGHFHRPFVYGI